MQYFIFVLFFCLFLLLFSVFIFSKEDVLFLRKNVTLDFLFNCALLASLGALFSSRLLYVLFNWSPNYLNPLVFFVFPYFPGLLLFGGIMGGWLVLLFLLHSKKTFPKARIADFFALSTLSVFPIGYIGYVLLSGSSLVSLEGFYIVFYIILFFFFLFYFFRKTKKRELEEGSVAYLFLSLVSFFALVSTIATNNTSTFSYWFQIGLYFLSFVFFLFLLNKNEKVLFIPQRRM